MQALTSTEVAGHAAAMEAAFLKAAERRGISSVLCDIGGVRISLDFAGAALAAAFRPAFADIQASEDGTAQVRLRIFESAHSGVPIPTFERPMQALIGWRGECDAEAGPARKVLFDAGTGGPSVVDTVAGTGVIAIDDLTRLPYWVLAAPFRAELAMLLQSHGIQFVHGAAVGGPEGVVLLTGYGGSGKSTTALLCHRRALAVLGDDYVALKAPAAADVLPTLHRVYSSFKLVPHEVGPRATVAAGQEKVVLFPYANDGCAPIRAAPCVGFWNAQLTDTPQTRLVPRHPEDVARIAFASTGLQLPGDDERMRALITACARAVRTTQQINLGTDRAAVVDTIERYLQDMAGRDGAPPGGNVTAASAPAPVWAQPGAIPKITVIMPVHNAAHGIAQAVRAIEAQRLADLELIIVDDGSTDALDAALSAVSLPYRLVRQPRRGSAAARNVGLDLAEGEWIAFQDGHEHWVEGALHRLAHDLALHPDAHVVHGRIIAAPDFGEGEDHVTEPMREHPLRYCINGALHRRVAFLEAGRFDEGLYHGEDIEWFVRLRMRARSVVIPEVVAQRTRKPAKDNAIVSGQSAVMQDSWKKILRQRMEARRGR